MKYRIWTGVCLLAFLLSGCGKTDSYFEKATEAVGEEETQAFDTQAKKLTQTEEQAECYVHVCGAVAQPGVYRLPAKSRIFEAIRMAGGLLETACGDSVNQALEVTDGLMVKILTKEEAEAAGEKEAVSGKEAAGEKSDGRVNLNTADENELMKLPGIGASKAESIVSYRRDNGSFSSIEEIKNITGIKEGVFSKIKDYITVN